MLLVDDILRTDHARMPAGPLYRYQYSNHLGSACVELDHQAGIISYEEYHPYGTSAYRAVSSRVEVLPKRYRYTGKERDEESGLYYHGARYYASWLERWVSCDPAEAVTETNLFFYAADNPVNYLDPDGRDIVWSQYWQGLQSGAPKTLSKYLNAHLWVAEVFSVPLGGPAWRFDDEMSFRRLTDQEIKADRGAAARTNEGLKETLAKGPGYTAYAATKSVVLGIGGPIDKAVTTGYRAVADEGPSVMYSYAFGEATPDAAMAVAQAVTMKLTLSSGTGLPPSGPLPALATAEGFVMTGSSTVARTAPTLPVGILFMASKASGEPSGESESSSNSSPPDKKYSNKEEARGKVFREKQSGKGTVDREIEIWIEKNPSTLEKAEGIRFDAANRSARLLEEWTTPNQINITAPGKGKWDQIIRANEALAGGT